MKKNNALTQSNPFIRGHFTWLAYGLLACFAYLQTTPGPIIPFLHAEMHLDYTLDSLHLSAVALGMILAGLFVDRLSARFGRRLLLWGGTFGMLVGALVVAFSHYPAMSIIGMFVIGLMGATVQIMVLSTLADQHGQYRAVAITEANMIASIGAGLAPICLGVLVLVGIGWRGVLFVPLAFVLLLVLFGFKSQVPQSQQEVRQITSSRMKLPTAFWLYWMALIMGVAAEWSVSFWGADYLNRVVGIARTPASTLMSLFFLAAVIGRFIMSRLTRSLTAERLLLPVLGVAMSGFLLFWLGTAAWINIAGLFIAGLGIANMFPLTVTATTNRIPRHSDLASARATFGGGLAVFFSPLILGRIADLVDLRHAFSLVLFLFVMVGVFTLLASRSVKRAYIEATSTEIQALNPEPIYAANS